MKLNLYSIYDRVSGLYSTPIAFLNNGVAIRSFVSIMHESSNTITSHDSELYIIGEFDTQLGVGAFFSKPEFIISYESIERGEADV